MDKKRDLVERIYNAYYNIGFATPTVIISDISNILCGKRLITNTTLGINEAKKISSNIVSKCKGVYIFDKEKLMEIISKEVDDINIQWNY